MIHQDEHVPKIYHLVQDVSPSTNNNLPRNSAPIHLRSSDDHIEPFDFTFQVVEPTIFRTTFTSPSRPLPPHPSIRRDILASKPAPSGCSCTVSGPRSRRIRTPVAEAHIEWSDAPIVSLFLNTTAPSEDGTSGSLTNLLPLEPIHKDLPYRSYAADGPGIARYSALRKNALHVGLGEKAAPMDLTGRSFAITASDTFGYDAYLTDPLYKHIPLLITADPSGCVALFSTSHARASYAVGSEIDGLWGRYKAYRQAHGGLEEYLIVGHTLEDILRSYARLVGFPLRVPRYMMGYIAGGMRYSMQDDPPACDAIVDFLDSCARHDIPCSAFQMSSGYTIAQTEPKTRNVFTWNKHRFPDPTDFARRCHERGVRLLANLKPFVLKSHPEYARLATGGAFLVDPATKGPGIARLWSAGGGESGEGSHLDFSSRSGWAFWYEGVKSFRGEVGIDGMWNDNNEFTVPSDHWQLALEGGGPNHPGHVPEPPSPEIPEGMCRRDIGLWGRAVQTELMGKCSHDAACEAKPEERPLVLTRSATAGTMRYAASSWSGDNITSWRGMRGGNALALNAGCSLLPCYGHDTGGFEGPQPTPELLVRWVQLGIHSARFAINCYKTCDDDNLIGEVIEPWMYPEVTPLVRAAIRRRYELVPYTYSQCLWSHFSGCPPQRWTGWGYETDPEVWTEELKAGDTQYWFGDALMVGGVYEPGATTARVYLPRNSTAEELTGFSEEGFINTHASYEYLQAGKWHEISLTWETSIPVIARVGSAIPVGKGIPNSASRRELDEFPSLAKDDWRGLEIFPLPVGIEAQRGDLEGAISRRWYASWLEDDGISPACEARTYKIELSYTATRDGIIVSIGTCIYADGKYWEPLWVDEGIDVILPVGEERPVVVDEAVRKRWTRGDEGERVSSSGAASDMGRDERGRRVFRVQLRRAEPGNRGLDRW